ncbi:MAG: type I DNA topoisomerase [Bacteroidetes bacterium]|nr:type I DNA topoisomerase [bacterium]NBP63421.1 type I DNA topoisomerase [Bacteroidota bacterium]
MAKHLVIVESPAKAKTIEGYLGKDYIVKASMGHIRDLAKGNDAIDVKHGFKPEYIISEGKEQVVSELKKLSKKVDTVWLATDEDREGEAIAWHLYDVLGLSANNSKRFVYHEVTKKAILKAIEQPREIDYDLVNAQQARRVLDRLVGFELSPILWRKVRPSLSAGRVQSVAVRLIVEREREIQEFNAQSSFKVTGTFIPEKEQLQFQAELSTKFDSAEEAEQFLLHCAKASYSVINVETKPGKKSPSPPFTTSTLQQEASRKLGFSIDRTMRLAQILYEAGHITYMRTDSVNLSDDSIALCSSAIERSFGKEYVQTRKYQNKSSNAQEAHEAIRPTDFSATPTIGKDEDRLYDLIRKRAIASQMADAKLEKTTATIEIKPSSPHSFIASGEVIKFDGFLAVYSESQDDDTEQEDDKRLPALQVGEDVTNLSIKAIQRFSKPSARYTEASLVKKLEELGIGRPSTYAPTISTIQKRNYVLKDTRDGKKREYLSFTLTNAEITKEILTENHGAEKSKLFPTDIGMIVNDFLVKNFGNIVDYHFTAHVEEQFDEIARGELQWNTMLQEFYTPFHSEVSKIMSGPQGKATSARELGTDPASGLTVYATLTRFGSAVQIGETGGEIPPKFASLKQHQSIATITIEEALDLFKLPRSLGLFEEKEVKVGIGRFGPYIVHNSVFTSLKVEDDPYTIELDLAIERIIQKREIQAARLIKSFPESSDITIVNGRFGPYVSYGKSNVKIPKGTDPASLTLEQCHELAKDQGKTLEKYPAKTKKGNTKKEDKPAAKAPVKKVAAPKKAAKKSATKKTATKKTSTKTSKKKED